jgi:flagellar basal-body rod protein FlgB
MLTQAMHNQNTILGAAMHGTAARLDVIMNNIANNDTPGFRAKTVDFEDTLARAVDRWRRPGNQQIDLSGVRPSLRTAEPGFTFRIDDNSVDMEREMVKFTINITRYEVLVNSVLNNSRRLNAAITGR